MKLTFFWMMLSLGVWVVPSFAETSQPDRIQGAITNSPTVMLQGNIHPKARPQYDMGPVESNLKPSYITMVLQQTAAQQADEKKFLQDLQNPSSPSYHNWLTPEQYADRFGVSKHDIAKIVNWLAAQGFEVLQPARGRNWVAFTGTSDLIAQVFQTQIHYYMVDGEKHFANSSNPVIPQSLAGIVMGFRGMDNFAPKPHIKNKGVANPFYSGGGFNNLGPADVATIYDIQALISGGTTGSGQKLVVVGQTDIDTTDIAQFRSGFGLSATLPQITIVPGDADPGTTGDLGEADLDIEWAGAVAQNATLLYIIGDPVNGNGVFDSAQYAIDSNLAPVISMSYGGCESLNVTFIPFFETEMQKASMLGITFIASSGDSGAAGCDSDQSAQATMGLAVNYPASSPEATGVGGTEFNEGTGTYWGSNGKGLGSALSYIPEIAWNDTSINQSLSAAGGGKSSCGVESNGSCTGGFTKPSWQTGPGVPVDGVRDVPDVAMAASADHDGYIFCSQGNCAGGIASALQNFPNTSIVGGTSASAPVFAGIITLLNDYIVTKGIQSKPGLGNINTKLYKLAQTASSAFHDTTSGNNIVPCQQGSTGCPASAPFQYGYSAGVGYDQVTGVGTVDANELVLAFAGNSLTTLTLNPAPTNGQYVGSSQIVTLTATVTASGTTGTPTGTITFMDGTATLGTPQTLVSGTASLVNWNLPGGPHSLTAVYSGDSKFTASTSAAIPVLVTLNMPNTTAVQLSTSSTQAGNSVTITGTVAPNGGGATPTGSLTFFNGTTALGTGTLSGGSVALNNTFSTGGTFNISATYSGDANYGITSSTPQTLNVMDFSLTQNASMNISAPGGNGSASITATPLGGFSGKISYACSGAPSEATCTVTATSTGATVMVATTAATSGQLQHNRSNGLFYAMLLPGMLGMLLVGRKKKSYRAMQMITLIVILGMSTLWMAACGGGPSGGSGGNSNPGTPAGVSTLTITATSGSLTRTAPVALNIL